MEYNTPYYISKLLDKKNKTKGEELYSKVVYENWKKLNKV